ncbi:MAG: lamin tail domain-containing protein [Candidatus Staskawiczbacteria bacterium]|nr:lamin tail domain-containing protein [Candidatus Staskawiczbacteria bacterium]
MKFARFFTIFLMLFLVFSFRYVYDFASAKLFSASLLSMVSPEKNIPIEPLRGGEIAMSKKDAPIYEVVVENNQEKIDDILEKIDILQQQLLELNRPSEHIDESDELNNEPVPVVANIEPVQPVNNVIVASAVLKTGGGGANFSKIVISEVQIGGLADSKEEFVELYNPSASDVDLTSWYVQRKTKGGSSYATFASNTLFLNKRITSKGYFLIAREGFLSGLAEIVVDNPLTEDNSLILKNPNGEISDKVGWGQSQDFESFPTVNPMPGYSIGRNGDEQDTNMNSVDFEADNPTPGAKNFPYVAPVEVLVELKDTIAPEVVFNLGIMQKELSFPVDFTITDPVGVVSGSGIGAFAFRWKEESGDWHEDAYENVDGSPSVFSSSRGFTGLDEKTYYFQVKAKDIAGNESDWLPEILATTKISLFKKILISEIQTAGVNAKDEFIILYNPNAVDMNLVGFTLKKKTSTGTESNLVSSGSFTGVILADGYFLIAPQDNDDQTKNYTGSLEPDLRYSGKSFSVADNNTILFYNIDNELLDKVGFGSAQDFETAPAENPPESKSIVRSETHSDTEDNAVDFKIKEEDIVPPIISNGTPEGELALGSTQVNLGVTTNESAECKYAPTPAQIYNEMTGAFSAIDGLVHTATIDGLADGGSYVYYVKCDDASGNKNTEDFTVMFSVASPELELPPSPQVVVINEIAWMGTASSANDEWMELFNPGDEAISLSGWELESADGTPKILLSASIDAHGFYLLERTSDDSVLGVTADQIYTGALGNAGEHMYLRNASGDVIDEVDSSAEWFSGNNTTKQTMQRKDFSISGNSADNWQTSQDPGGSPRL